MLRLANYNGGTFNWLGKWTKSDIETVEIINNSSKLILDNSKTTNKYDGLTFIIKQPQNLRIRTYREQGTITVYTGDRSVKVELSGIELSWSGATYEGFAL